MSAIDVKTLDDLGWPGVVDQWASRCASARGAAAVRAQPFFAEVEAARARVAEVAEARLLASRDARLPLGGIEDCAAAIARVRKAAALDAPELLAVAGTARALAALRQHLHLHAELAPRLLALGGRLVDLGHVYHPILDAFGLDGRLVDHASDALGSLRRTLAAIKVQLERRMKTLVDDERFAPFLQDTFYTQRDDRYVLPVRHDGKGFVKGILHGTSGSGQTLFIEPEEIVDLNNKLKLAECDVHDEEARILARFSGWVAEEADAIDAGLADAEVLDVIGAAARLADDLVAAAPIIDDAPRVGLLHARHPGMLLAERRCVANDIEVAARSTLLVSGPNAGGKTVALKTAGLCALMTRAGLHLPAEPGSVMGWFVDVRSDIGDAQSLEANLSTFTGHILALRTYLAECGAGTLLLIDEIAVGTDPDQGAALAQAVLEALAARGVTAIVTTHYERLKALGASDPRFANASVGFDLERLLPTFKLHLGVPGSSGALTVARTTGLGDAVVDRAAALLGTGGVQVELLLERVADQRRRLEEERAMQLDELEALEAERMAVRADRQQQKQRAAKQADGAYGEAVVSLREARKEVEQVRSELRQKAAAERAKAEDVQRARRKLAVAASTVHSNQPERALPPGRAAQAGELVPGTPVILVGLGGRGEVVGLPERGRVAVRLGAMHTSVPVSEVLLDVHRKAAGPTEPRAHAPAKRRDRTPAPPEVTLVDGAIDGKASARTLDTTLDVRGQRADDAIQALERFLDEALLLSREAIFIIHGHGTGALRTALRAHLKRHAAAASFRPGGPSEGGDGVTVVFLKT